MKNQETSMKNAFMVKINKEVNDQIAKSEDVSGKKINNSLISCKF